MKAAWGNPGGAWTLRASEPYARATPEAVRRAIAEVLDAAPSLRAHALGVCVPGIVDPASGRIERAVNLPDLQGHTLDALLPAALAPRPMRFVSDARAAAFDASRDLPGRSAALVLGTGVGLSVLDDGVPLRISGESSGHLGQLDLHLPGEPGFGRTVEETLGARALEARHGSPLPDLDLPAQDDTLRELARLLRLVHAIYRPRHMLILGGVGMALRPSLGRLIAMASDRLTPLAREGWTLRGPVDAFHAVRGAAMLAAEIAS